MNCSIFSKISILVLVLQSLEVFASGSSIEIKSFEHIPGGTPYVKVGQVDRMGHSTPADKNHIFINYELNGEQRRLLDDDGLATLYIYHRSLASRIFNQQIRMTDNAPGPLEHLSRSFDMLSATYERYANNSAVSADIRMKLREAIQRIPQVKAAVLRSKTVQDLSNSGLESLINDTVTIHAYDIESPGQSRNIRLTEAIGVGVPTTFSSTMAGRCRDQFTMNWSEASSGLALATRPTSGQKATR